MNIKIGRKHEKKINDRARMFYQRVMTREDLLADKKEKLREIQKLNLSYLKKDRNFAKKSIKTLKKIYRIEK